MNEPPRVNEERVRALELSISYDGALMTEALATGLLLQEDQEVRAKLQPGVDPLYAFLGNSTCWVELDNGKDMVLHRERPDRNVVHLQELARRDAELANFVQSRAAKRSVYQRASAMVLSMLSITRHPSREEIASVQIWRPALESLCYRASARATALVDEFRPKVMNELPKVGASSPTLRRYWAYVSLISRMTLLAASEGARRWLVDMSRSFTWVNWTPSFPLLRERSLYHAAIAGRAAAAFGEPVIEEYLGSLRRARTVLAAFDALFGLAAIAISSPSAQGPIVKEIAAHRSKAATSKVWDHDSLDSAYETTFAVIRDPDSATAKARSLFEWKLEGIGGLATPVALRVDATAYSRNGESFGLLALPMALTAPVSAFFPTGAEAKRRPRMWLSAPDIAAVFRGAYVTDRHAAEESLH